MHNSDTLLVGVLEHQAVSAVHLCVTTAKCYGRINQLETIVARKLQYNNVMFCVFFTCQLFSPSCLDS